MNLDAIKKKLDSMSKSTNNTSSGNNYPQTRKFKPFTEMKFYYNIGKFRMLASPLNWDEKDPIAEFAKQLRGTNDKENWRLAKKLDPKTRIFAPVIVRGQESEGVQLWEFGKEIYEAFLQMAADEEVGDFSDIMNGRDIKLVTVGPDVTGTKYNKTTISPSMKQTQLSTDKNLVETWLEDQQNPKETYRPLPFDTIKGALQEWLSPEEENEGDIISQPAEGFSDDKVDSNYSLSNKKKETKSDKFDAMFDEENDDLPF